MKKTKIDFSKPIRHTRPDVGKAEYHGLKGEGRFKHLVIAGKYAYYVDDYGTSATGNRRIITNVEKIVVAKKPGRKTARDRLIETAPADRSIAYALEATRRQVTAELKEANNVMRLLARAVVNLTKTLEEINESRLDRATKPNGEVTHHA